MTEVKIYLPDDDTEYICEIVIHSHEEIELENVYVSCDQSFKHAPIDIDAPVYKDLVEALYFQLYTPEIIADYYADRAGYFAELERDMQSEERTER